MENTTKKISTLVVHPANLAEPILEFINYPESKIMFKGEEISSEQFIAMLLISAAPDAEQTRMIHSLVAEDLEGFESSAGFWGRTAARQAIKKEKLAEDNVLLRRAAQEMKRMLPVIKYFEQGDTLEKDDQMTWAEQLWELG